MFLALHTNLVSEGPAVVKRAPGPQGHLCSAITPFPSDLRKFFAPLVPGPASSPPSLLPICTSNRAHHRARKGRKSKLDFPACDVGVTERQKGKRVLFLNPRPRPPLGGSEVGGLLRVHSVQKGRHSVTPLQRILVCRQRPWGDRRRAGPQGVPRSAPG